MTDWLPGAGGAEEICDLFVDRALVEVLLRNGELDPIPAAGRLDGVVEVARNAEAVGADRRPRAELEV